MIMKKNSIKNERINAEVQRALSQILREDVKDPRLPLMLSVTRCIVAPDLKTCKAYISVLGTAEQRRDTMEGLKSASGFIRREVANNVNLRITPEIEFISDDSIEYGVSMSRRIDDVIDEDLKNQEGRIDTDEQYTG